jgi:ABC-type lipoprotein export system ATPase subunit
VTIHAEALTKCHDQGRIRVVTLRAEGLTKTYGETDAVFGADFSVGQDEFIAIVGRSGSGKSTLMGMIGALMQPTSGRVVFGGRDLAGLSEPQLADLRRSEFGFVFQFPSLLPNLRAIDNVALPAMLGPNATAADAYEKARSLLERVGLGRRLDAYPSELSGGEQRRVVIARALINSPRVLLADEPTGDLDEDTEREIIELIESLRRATPFAIVLVTHNIELTTHADRAFVMERGALKPFSAPSDASEPVRHVRRFAMPPPANDQPPPEAAVEIGHRLGRDLWRLSRNAIAAAVVLFVVTLGLNFAVERYQTYQLQQKRDRLAELEELAMSTLRGDIASVTRLGDNRFRVQIYLENSDSGGQPIYIMSPELHAFVQVGLEWRELPLEPVGDSTASVLKVTGRQLYSYEFEANVSKFTALMPYYMHVRFNNNMLVSPESNPKDDLFSRSDNYYIYLRPDGVDDATIAKRVKFSGPPPLWIWMPPH